MSLQFVPSADHPESIKSNTLGRGAPSMEAIPDSMRQGKANTPIASQINGQHPLQQRLEKWDETQWEFKLQTVRQTYGAAEPIKRSMELGIVNQLEPPSLLGHESCIHRDILKGQETSIGWEDVYPDAEPVMDMHAAMRKRMGL